MMRSLIIFKLKIKHYDIAKIVYYFIFLFYELLLF